MKNICKLYLFINHYLRYRLSITNNDNSHTHRISTSMFTFTTKGRQLSNKINLKMYVPQYDAPYNSLRIIYGDYLVFIFI